MDSVHPKGKVSPCVEMIEACGEWFVRIVSDDGELTHSFEHESLAMAYAEGQRIRLRLDKVVRL
ncbi:hypothetical protein EN935_00035 [Mesorhizobium sp. M7D.F.Ca.US.004.03.1.1]|nr:hypothetical protein EN993_14340 [Mesorhizobium sp. M7D.F.Ca.US.004.01.2.1]RVA37201.1 hypothetical protein EN935_00035 [Mesorhizobium sp. M7D.F.Ca.US.004.03.1.1]